jgi:predicted aspartyl protease
MPLLRRTAFAVPLLALSLTGLVSGCADPGSASFPQACKVAKAADIAITVERGFIDADATMDGRPATLVIDTGSERSLVTPAAMAEYHLPEDARRTTTIHGAGGTIVTHNAMVRSFGIGGLELIDQSTSVGPLPIPQGASMRAAGLVGADWLRSFDVELDLPHRRMALYRVSGCDGDYLPWQGKRTSVIAQIYHQGLVLLPVEVDGQRLTAMLDSGANNTMLTETAAARIGVEPATLTRGATGHATGVDGAVTTTHRHRFDRLRIGDIAYANPSISIGAFRFTGADMLLGADWLRTHRVWISYASHHVAFQRAVEGGM